MVYKPNRYTQDFHLSKEEIGGQSYFNRKFNRKLLLKVRAGHLN